MSSGAMVQQWHLLNNTTPTNGLPHQDDMATFMSAVGRLNWNHRTIHTTRFMDHSRRSALPTSRNILDVYFPPHNTPLAVRTLLAIQTIRPKFLRVLPIASDNMDTGRYLYPYPEDWSSVREVVHSRPTSQIFPLDHSTLVLHLPRIRSSVTKMGTTLTCRHHTSYRAL